MLRGSKERSLFLHATTDFWQAREWATKDYYKKGGESTIVQIDIEELHAANQNSTFKQQGFSLVIDISTHAAVSV